jgi:hypothetical protein
MMISRVLRGRRRGWWAVTLTLLASLVLAGGAYGAFAGLPGSGQQVNDDPPTIDPNQNANLTDLTAGSLAGGGRVPWAAFAQSEADGAAQIVVRAFKNGAWQTEGFPESLNVDPSATATAPSIDFTGANRTVPWVSWAEPSTALGASQIFASRFLQQAPPAQNGGQWIHEGQEVSSLHTIPSLNINTDRDAKDPSLIGGTTTAGANPAPWITWQEADNGNSVAPGSTPGNSHFQIFVEHAVPATAGACPAMTKPARGNSVGSFCFQQVGTDRVQGEGKLDPSLNVDPTRDGIQADIAFTGANDTVPWVVWYENSDDGNSSLPTPGLNADMVFAARAVPDPSGDGGFHWQVVGLGTAGRSASEDILNTSGANGAGDCATTQAIELQCSLDADQSLSDAQALTDGNGAENPQVTAGTMVAGKATTPWVTWDESNANGGLHSVFVARLDPGGDHFDLLNNGQPISHSGLDSTRPDIAFAGNTPYVSWHETNPAGQTVTVVGHFEGNPADPVFHIDSPDIPTTPQGTSDDDTTDVRSPLASSCPDDPFTADGQACTGGVVGTPFFAFTDDASGPQQLFAQGYTPGTTQTGAASGVTDSAATVAGAVSTDGARVLVHFDYGASTAYGASTPMQLLQPASGVSTPFAAQLTGLPAGTIIHYRAVAQTDFGTVDGQDQTLHTAAAAPPPVASIASGTAKVKNGVASVLVACQGISGQTCDGTLSLSIRVRKFVGHGHHRHRVTVTLSLGSAGVQLGTGEVETVHVRLNGLGRNLLASAPGRRLGVRATITLDGSAPATTGLELVQARRHHG